MKNKTDNFFDVDNWIVSTKSNIHPSYSINETKSGDIMSGNLVINGNNMTHWRIKDSDNASVNKPMDLEWIIENVPVANYCAHNHRGLSDNDRRISEDMSVFIEEASGEFNDFITSFIRYKNKTKVVKFIELDLEV